MLRTLSMIIVLLAVPAQLVLYHMQPKTETRYEAQWKFFKPFYSALNYVEDSSETIVAWSQHKPWLKAVIGSLPFSTQTKVSDELGALERGPEALELDAANFRRGLHQYKNVLVNFYAPWCIHCKNFEATYSEIAKSIHTNETFNNDTLVSKMDATIHPRLVARHNIHAFPSLLLYINGDIDNPSHYQGPREAVDVIDWTLETAANPPLSSFYGFAQNPRYLRFRYDISYRIGDVVHLTTDEREMPHLGVIVGWDYTMQAPAVSSENKLKPHYRVLWDTSKGQAIPEDTNSNLGEHSSPNVNYLCQDDLDLYIGRVTTIEHPLLEKHFYSKFKMNRLLPKSWLHSQYPDDVKF